MFQLPHVKVTHARMMEHAHLMILEDTHVLVAMGGQEHYVKYVSV